MMTLANIMILEPSMRMMIIWDDNDHPPAFQFSSIQWTNILYDDQNDDHNDDDDENDNPPDFQSSSFQWTA